MNSTVGDRANRIVCPLCGGSTSFALDLGHASVRKCSNRDCGLEFASPQLNADQLSNAYRRLYYPNGSGNHQVTFENTSEAVLEQFFDLLTERLGSLDRMRVLDYGCGFGRLLRIARTRGCEATGIESDSVARMGAHDRSDSQVFASIDDLQSSRPDAQFDIIILWTVIEHLRTPWVDVARLRTLLRPDGWLYVSTMDTRCLRARVEGPRWENYVNPTHLFYFNERSLRAALLNAGFSDPLRWHLKFHYPHHGLLRRIFYNATFSLGLADGLSFVCQNNQQCDRLETSSVSQGAPLTDQHHTASIQASPLLQRQALRGETE